MLSYKFPPFYSGAGKQALTLSCSLKRKGVEIFVLTGNFGNTPSKDNIRGIPVYRIPILGKRGGKYIQKLCFFFGTLLFLYTHRRKYRIIHIHSIFWPYLSAFLLAKIFKGKIIIKMTMVGHDDPLAIKKRKFGGLQLRLFLLADKFISISSALSDSYKQMGLPLVKLELIPNGVDINRFHPVYDQIQKAKLRESLGLPSGEIATFVGPLVQRKRIDFLIEIWRDIVKRIPEARLLLIGPYEGSSEDFDAYFFERIKKMIKEYELEDNVYVLGEIDEVEKYLQVSSIFIFPSIREGLPNALMEAMACGLPCVVLKIKGISENIIKNNREGILINNQDKRAFIDAILYLLKTRGFSKKIGEKARMKIERDFSINKIAGKYVSIYKELLNQ